MLFSGGYFCQLFTKHQASCLGRQGHQMELQDGQTVPLETKQSEQVRQWQQQHLELSCKVSSKPTSMWTSEKAKPTTIKISVGLPNLLTL